MYCFHEIPKHLAEKAVACRQLLSEICQAIEPRNRNVKISADSRIDVGVGLDSKLWILRDGAVSVARGKQQIFVLDEGDLLGFEDHFFARELCYSSEFAIVVDEYLAKDFFETIATTPALFPTWNSYLAHYSHLVSSIMLALVDDDALAAPKFCSFDPGEIIIEQGTDGSEAYNLVEGHAEVFVDGVKVGEIFQDEIFGAIGALTETPRTATVKASQPCMALELPKDGFASMLKSRPNTVQQMVESMARTIVELNQKIVKQAD